MLRSSYCRASFDTSDKPIEQPDMLYSLRNLITREHPSGLFRGFLRVQEEACCNSFAPPLPRPRKPEPSPVPSARRNPLFYCPLVGRQVLLRFRGEPPETRICNKLIGACRRGGYWEACVQIVELMRWAGVPPDTRTLNLLTATVCPAPPTRLSTSRLAIVYAKPLACLYRRRG